MKRRKISLVCQEKVVVTIFAIFVALLHFITGPGYSGPFPDFVNGYMIDILLPCAMFLILKISNQNILTNDMSLGIFVFLVGAISETLQFFNVPIFGRTFDPLDYIMFIIGIILGYSINKFFLVKFS